MKHILVLLMTFFFCVNAFTQDQQVKRVSEEACPCIGEIRTDIKEKKKFKQIKECITSANISIQFLSSLGIQKSLDSLQKNELEIDSLSLKSDKEILIDIEKDYEQIEEYLLRNCESMKVLMASRDVERRKSVSNKEKARIDYDLGQRFFSEGKYAIAIEHYKNAVKRDSRFAFAWDMIGYSYRKLNDYDNAILNYQKSLEIDPKGKMPLINIAYAYEYKEDYDSAIDAMNNYIKIYPKDAEGYYGLGRLFHLKQDYRNALDNTMKSYLMYKELNSPYARDAEHNIALFYNNLKELDQLEIFEEIAKKYNIQISE